MRKYYYMVHRESRTYSGWDEFKTLRQALKYIKKTYKNTTRGYGIASEYTLTIEQHEGWDLVEKRELRRLKKKYESK